MDRWDGKTAVVTGASVGIGAAIAVSLADAGLNVVGLARRPHIIEKLNNEVKTGKGKIFAKECDISSTEDIVKVFDSINDQFGGINIIVNNAGCVITGTFTDVGEKVVSDEDIERVIKVNTLGLITCSREAVKYMKKTGEQGHIVNISSIAGHYVMAACGLPRWNIYFGSKHAVQATSEAMRLEFSHSKSNIKITCVSPGIVRTDMTKHAMRENSKVEGFPLLFELLEPSDIADAVISAIATPPRVNISEIIIRPIGDIW